MFVELESAAFYIVRQRVPLSGIEKIGFVVMFDERGKSVLTQKIHPADIVVAENLNGCHGAPLFDWQVGAMRACSS